jgi:hypothetical protein
VLLDQLEEGFDFSHQASLTNGEIRGSAEILHRIETSSYLGDWRYIPIECKLASKPRTTFLVQASAYCEPLTTCWGRGRITLSCTWAVVASAPTTPIAAGLGTSSCVIATAPSRPEDVLGDQSSWLQWHSKRPFLVWPMKRSMNFNNTLSCS